MIMRGASVTKLVAGVNDDAVESESEIKIFEIYTRRSRRLRVNVKRTVETRRRRGVGRPRGEMVWEGKWCISRH
jgi:hypothetical protein